MKEIVLDFRRYKGLGFSVREAAEIARMRHRVRRTLIRHETSTATPSAPAGK